MKKMKVTLTLCLVLAVLTFVTGCAPESSPYELNDAEGYTVSVKYDANGGTFTTNTSVIVDSYNLSELSTGSDGKARIALLAPDNSLRGNDAFTAINNGYFLAGWYTERTETTDENGNPAYSYSGKWDFEADRLAVNTSDTYTSAEPVMTLYAAWVPLFRVEFYDRTTGEYLDAYQFNPITDGQILIPAWDEETGAIEMYDFPQRSGYTFDCAYYDAAGTRKVDTAALTHTGSVDTATGTATGCTMSVYLDWTEGEWYHIYNVEQFLDNASVNGNYVLHADLDFADEIWPTALMYGNFSGSIEGNGHTMRNITVTQTNNSKVNAGLFGQLSEEAVLKDVTFENVTFHIKSGTRVTGASFGLLAGTISDAAVLDGLTVASGCVQIDSGCYFGSDDYSIGLLCGMGNADRVDYSTITCQAVGDDPQKLLITADGNSVDLKFVE